ncbi:MAG: hypothetical protein ACJ72A_14790 [Nocardioidaceae bacterium]
MPAGMGRAGRPRRRSDALLADKAYSKKAIAGTFEVAASGRSSRSRRIGSRAAGAAAAVADRTG